MSGDLSYKSPKFNCSSTRSETSQDGYDREIGKKKKSFLKIACDDLAQAFNLEREKRKEKREIVKKQMSQWREERKYETSLIKREKEYWLRFDNLIKDILENQLSFKDLISAFFGFCGIKVGFHWNSLLRIFDKYNYSYNMELHRLTNSLSDGYTIFSTRNGRPGRRLYYRRVDEGCMGKIVSSYKMKSYDYNDYNKYDRYAGIEHKLACQPVSSDDFNLPYYHRLPFDLEDVLKMMLRKNIKKGDVSKEFVDKFFYALEHSPFPILTRSYYKTRFINKFREVGVDI